MNFLLRLLEPLNAWRPWTLSPERLTREIRAEIRAEGMANLTRATIEPRPKFAGGGYALPEKRKR